MIPQRNISKISNKTHETGGGRIPETVIERDYCLAWFLFGLSMSPLKQNLIFKGGTALRRCYFEDYRFSEELDFTLIEPISLKEILENFEHMFSWLKDETGICFSHCRQEPSSTNTHTFYISYLGPLPGKEKEVKIDVTFKEKIIRPIEEKNIIKTYEEYEDFPDKLKIRVYGLDEVAIEKTCALFSKARNEPRDLYDMYYLIMHGKLDLHFLAHNVQTKMNFKGILFETVQNEFLKKQLGLKKLWKTRLSLQMVSMPEYDRTFRTVKRTFRQVGLL